MLKVKVWTILALISGGALLLFYFQVNAQNIAKNNASYTILAHWELPPELREVSGIAWLGDDRMAAVQDEDATIFIYDLKNNKVAEKIDFGDPGDYEGLAISGKDAYVLRSDGAIFEIEKYQSGDFKVKVHHTMFSEDNNMETLELDRMHDQLLIAPKDHNPGKDNFKNIYAFSLETKKVNVDPVFKIDLEDKVLKPFRKRKSYKTFRPSDLAIHPITREIYILEGSSPKLLILDSGGNAKKAYSLDKKTFPQPEGITFSPEGILYIASEGKKGGVGTIIKLKLEE